MIVNADSYQYLDTLSENSIDTVITDPPYGLKFMGKKWDYDIPRVDFWEKVYRVCKPGAIMLIFGGTRTYHRLAVEIEDAGFEIRDCIMWLYGQGFPKSYDISKGIDKSLGVDRTEILREGAVYEEFEDKNTYGHGLNANFKPRQLTKPSSDEAELWDGWGTALKPAWEPIIVAMKPLDGTYAENALKHGVAGLNIDGSRIDVDSNEPNIRNNGANKYKDDDDGLIYGKFPMNRYATLQTGRFPANIILDEEAALLLDEQTKDLKGGIAVQRNRDNQKHQYRTYGVYNKPATNDVGYGDKGGASRFFYVAKASRSERGKDNGHPTVKPIKLLEYLCKLTETPTSGIVLDPFMGSGSLGIAAHNTGREYLGIEIDQHYFEIAQKRIEAWKNESE